MHGEEQPRVGSETIYKDSVVYSAGTHVAPGGEGGGVKDVNITALQHLVYNIATTPIFF